MNQPTLERKHFLDLSKVSEFVLYFLKEDPILKGLQNPMMNQLFEMGLRPVIYSSDCSKISALDPKNLYDWLCLKIFYSLKNYSNSELRDFEKLIEDVINRSIVPLERIRVIMEKYNITFANTNYEKITFKIDQYYFFQSILDENANLAELHIFKNLYFSLFNKSFDLKAGMNNNSIRLNDNNLNFLNVIKYFIIHIPILSSPIDIEDKFGNLAQDITEERQNVFSQLGISDLPHGVIGQKKYFYKYEIDNHLFGEFSLDFLENSDSIISNRLTNVRIQVFCRNNLNALKQFLHTSINEIQILLGEPIKVFEDNHWAHFLQIELSSAALWEFTVLGKPYGVVFKLDQSNHNDPFVSIWISELLNP